MELAPHVEALLSDLTAIAAIGDEATAKAAQRLSAALRASAGLRLLDALGEAVLELNAQLPSGRVEIRLAGQDPALAFVEEEDRPAGPTETDATARITLRLPEGLKASVERAAAREGVSVNTWLVRALARSVSTPASRGPGSRLTGYARS